MNQRFPPIVLALLAILGMPALARQSATGSVLVLPFENVGREARLYWLEEASAVLLADNLNAMGVTAITRPERVSAFEQLHLPSTGSLSHATAIKVGLLVGASEVVLGTLEFSGGQLSVKARSIRLDTGRMRPEVLQRGPLPELFQIFERIARGLASSAGIKADEQRAESVRPPSLDAFESYIKGLVAEATETRIKFFESALDLQPRYDQAQLGLWEVYTDRDEHAKALAAVEAVSAGSPLVRRARFLGGLSQLPLKRYDEAFATFKALLDEEPAPALYNNLGVVQLRRGSTPQTGTPAYFFNKAVETEPGDQDYFFNLGYAYWADRDVPAAIYWLREAVRRDPTDGDAHFVLGAALQAANTPTEGAREKELARLLDADWERRPAAEPVPKGLERIKTELRTPLAYRLDTAVMKTAQREQRELAGFHLERGRRLFEQEQNQEAIAELRKSVFLNPYAAEPHLLLGRILLGTGQLKEAIEALKVSLWCEETVAAHIALAEAYVQADDTAAARREAERALTLDPASPGAKNLVDRLSRAKGQ
ncbi:MAG: tetratricopeptide repeat protein [Acidobacteria bacterium]|nr:tetratricopeptide repeat protein [Acidobacteriota bacterium]